jgi:hypothetical protein
MRHSSLVTLHEPAQRDVATTLVGLACAPERAPFVARGILGQIWATDRMSNRDLGQDARARIAVAMLDEAHCPGAAGLTQPERARLLAISEGLD